MALIQERFTGIADAIRAKTGRTERIRASNFARAISGITTAVPRAVGPRTVTPDSSNFDGAFQAMLCAMEYWNAKASGTRAFAYSDGDGCLKPGGAVNDAQGRAVMDCSTYMGLALRNVGYLHSPYAKNGAANATVDPLSVKAMPSFWAEETLDQQSDKSCSDLSVAMGGRWRALTASDVCRWLECQGLVWRPGERAPRQGDICFFSKTDADGTLHYPARWRGVSHLGIMTDDSHYLNITDYAQSGNLIRTSCEARPPELYGRPLYGGAARGGSGALAANSGLNLLPGLWAGAAQGARAVNGITVTCSGLALSFSGQPSSALNPDLVNSGCPLLLPEGTYRLSGVSNGTGTNTVSATHSLWGLRVYDASTGAGIPGTTWSSSGANTAQRTPVWDIGGGAQFTLGAATFVKVDFYGTSSRNIAGVGVSPSLTRVG